MPTKFVNVFETSKLRICGHYLDSVSYILLNFVTSRLFKNLAPGAATPARPTAPLAAPGSSEAETLVAEVEVIARHLLVQRKRQKLFQHQLSPPELGARQRQWKLSWAAQPLPDGWSPSVTISHHSGLCMVGN